MKKLLLILLLSNTAFALPNKLSATLNWWEYSYDREFGEFPTDPRADVTVQVKKLGSAYYWGRSKCSGSEALVCRKQRKVSGCDMTAILRVTSVKKRVTLGERYECKAGLFVVKRSGKYGK